LIVDSVTKTRVSSERQAQIKSEPEFEALAITVDDTARSSRRGVRWAILFWCALGGLLLLAIGVAVNDLLTDLLARNQELGWLGLAFATLAVVSLLVIAVRETTGLMRLAKVEKLRQRAAEMIVSDNRIEARAFVHELLALTRKMPHLARGRADLEGHLGEIIDGSDMVRLAERELMTPLDQRARKLISVAATRVSVVTAVSPRAVIDILFVFGTALTLVRRLAFLYGARPGTLSLARLVRQVVMHLAVTGGLAASDSLIQQMLGHGIAAKLSVRLGEGVLNGLLTARFGLAAVDLIRPVPFAALPRPTLSDLMSEVLRSFGDAEEQQGSESSLAITEVQ
jgi:putative membrane protein